MIFSRTAVLLAGLVALSNAVSIRDIGFGELMYRSPQQKGGQQGGQQAAAAASKNNAAAAAKVTAAATVTLDAKAIQTASNLDGNQTPADGQAASLTDPANFINFCSGQILTNGLQVKGGSCNGIVMGKIPSTSNMISAIIISPKPAENIAAKKDFTIQVQITGLTAGTFTNAAATYYSAPQNLASNGQIIGHTHVTVQSLGNNLQSSKAPDPNKFAFFKGINDAGNGKGLLSATVTGGLPAGNYRVCSMTSSANHQPVLMPIAQRGAQDDCQKFTVGAATAGGSAGANAATTAKSAATTTAAAAKTSGNGGKGRRMASEPLIADYEW